MAKKKTAGSSADPPQQDNPETAGQADENVDVSPKVGKAADAVQRAEAELKKAQQLFQQVREDATERLKAAREKTLGDLIDGTLRTVKKHPGPGVIVAVVIGFFLGRLFRR